MSRDPGEVEVTVGWDKSDLIYVDLSGRFDVTSTDPPPVGVFWVSRKQAARIYHGIAALISPDGES